MIVHLHRERNSEKLEIVLLIVNYILLNDECDADGGGTLFDGNIESVEGGIVVCALDVMYCECQMK